MLNRYTSLVLAAVIYTAVAMLGSGCAFEDGHPPQPRIGLAPDSVLENDGFQTLISLDATGSSDPIDDPNAVRPLKFRWHISNDEFRFESGDETSTNPTLKFRGDRPATIELTATDEDGFSGTTSVQLRLVVFR